MNWFRKHSKKIALTLSIVCLMGVSAVSLGSTLGKYVIEKSISVLNLNIGQTTVQLAPGPILNAAFDDKAGVFVKEDGKFQDDPKIYLPLYKEKENGGLGWGATNNSYGPSGITEVYFGKASDPAYEHVVNSTEYEPRTVDMENVGIIKLYLVPDEDVGTVDAWVDDGKGKVEHLEDIPATKAYVLTTNDATIIANKDCAYMFNGLVNCTKIDLSNLVVHGNVEDLRFMFYHCRKLNDLTVGTFNTKRVTNMQRMFANCWELTTEELYKVIHKLTFDTGNVTDMQGMLAALRRVDTLDLKNFDTRKVTDMEMMFQGNYSMTQLDLSGKNFDVASLKNVHWMFNGCVKLNQILVKPETDWSKSNVPQDESRDSLLFLMNYELEGEAGMTFAQNSEDEKYVKDLNDWDALGMHVNAGGGTKYNIEAACVDGVNGKKGFFTAVSGTSVSVIADDLPDNVQLDLDGISYKFTETEDTYDFTFTADNDYTIPETLIVAIGGKTYEVYTSGEGNPDGIYCSFDADTEKLQLEIDLALIGDDTVRIAIYGDEVVDEEPEADKPVADKPAADAPEAGGSAPGAGEKPGTGETGTDGSEATDPSEPTKPGEGEIETDGSEVTDPSEPIKPGEGETETDGSDATDSSEPTKPGEGETETDGSEATDPSEPSKPGEGETETDGSEATDPTDSTDPSEDETETDESDETDSTDSADPDEGVNIEIEATVPGKEEEDSSITVETDVKVIEE